MQPILKTKKTLIASALALGVTNVWAGTADFTINASTIPDVTVTQDQALSFGTAMRVTTGLTCTLDASDPGEDTLNFDKDGDTDVDTDAATFGALTGTGCINGSGNGSQAGLYTITGTGGSTVAITLAPLVETEFTFTPGNGCVPTYDDNGGTADTSGDPCTSLGNGTTTSLLIPDDTSEGDTDAPAGAASVANSLKFSLGGQIAVTNGGADLDPATLYSAQFDVTVVYE